MTAKPRCRGWTCGITSGIQTVNHRPTRSHLAIGQIKIEDGCLSRFIAFCLTPPLPRHHYCTFATRSHKVSLDPRTIPPVCVLFSPLHHHTHMAFFDASRTSCGGVAFFSRSAAQSAAPTVLVNANSRLAKGIISNTNDATPKEV